VKRYTLRETAKILGISHAGVIILERRAIAKLVVGLGIMRQEELPHRIRKWLHKGERLQVVA
jgi:hypothetical protein